MPALTHYEVLGIEPSAGADEIKKARNKKIINLHPDKYKGSDAKTKTQEVNEAYFVLSDADRRADYDRMQHFTSSSSSTTSSFFTAHDPLFTPSRRRNGPNKFSKYKTYEDYLEAQRAEKAERGMKFVIHGTSTARQSDINWSFILSAAEIDYDARDANKSVLRYFVDGLVANIMVWQCPSNSRYAAMDETYMKGSDGLLLAIDLQSKDSLAEMRTLLSAKAKDYYQQNNKNIILVGSYEDESKIVITPEEAKSLADAFGLEYMAVNPIKNGEVQDDQGVVAAFDKLIRHALGLPLLKAQEAAVSTVTTSASSTSSSFTENVSRTAYSYWSQLSNLFTGSATSTPTAEQSKAPELTSSNKR